MIYGGRILGEGDMRERMEKMVDVLRDLEKYSETMLEDIWS